MVHVPVITGGMAQLIKPASLHTRQWSVYHRYSDFKQLHAEVSRETLISLQIKQLELKAPSFQNASKGFF